MSDVLPFPELQRLRVPAGWAISHDKFYDFEPSEELLSSDANNWFLSDPTLLFCDYKQRNLLLVMSWQPSHDPNGQFDLSIVENDDWHNTQTICETRSKAEILEAINDTMLRISRENGDYNIEAKGVKLQELRFTPTDWKVIRNEFFELDPNGKMRVEGLPNQDGWQLFHEDLLRLEWFDEAKMQIRLGWFPAHNPDGQFKITATNPIYYDPPLVNFSTKDKAEAVEVIEHLIKVIHTVEPIKK